MSRPVNSERSRVVCQTNQYNGLMPSPLTMEQRDDGQQVANVETVSRGVKATVHALWGTDKTSLELWRPKEEDLPSNNQIKWSSCVFPF